MAEHDFDDARPRAHMVVKAQKFVADSLENSRGSPIFSIAQAVRVDDRFAALRVSTLIVRGMGQPD